MQLSNYALEQTGFRPTSDGEVVAGVFHSINVYEMRGLTTDTRALGSHLGQLDGIGFAISSGSSINAICQQMLGETFAEDENEWRGSKNCQPPYLAALIHRMAGIRWRVSHKRLILFRDWVSRPVHSPDQAGPHPPCMTIRLSRSAFQPLAARKSPPRLMAVVSPRTAA